MLKRAVTQTTTLTWAASSAVEEDLAKDGFITRIDAVAEITPDLTMATDSAPDGLFRIADNFTVEGGGRIFFTLPGSQQGSRILHLKNIFDHPGRIFHGEYGGISAPQGRTYVPVMFRFHAGSRPYDHFGRDNPFDLSAFIPGPDLGSLRFRWNTTAASVLDPTSVISSGVLRLTVFMVLGTKAEILAEMARQGVSSIGGKYLTPDWSGVTKAHDATYSAYSWEQNAPTGGFLRGVHLLAQDETSLRPLRAADEVTGVAIKLPKLGMNLVEVYTESLNLNTPIASHYEADAGAADLQAGTVAGYFPVNLIPHGTGYAENPAIPAEYGLDTRRMSAGDVKVGTTITTYTSGDDTLYLFDTLKDDYTF